jgi:hypothetical protein
MRTYSTVHGGTHSYTVSDDRLFNVDVNGQRVATGITREAASVYQVARRESGTGTCYVYLTDRPAPADRRRAYSAQSIPRLPSMRVSAATRQKLTDTLLAEGILQLDTEVTP